MRNAFLAIAIVFALTAPGSAFAGDKNKSKGIEVNDYGFGVSSPVTTSRSDGGGSTVGRVVSPTTKGPIGGSTGPTRPTLPTTSGQHR
jgi:hypothetical protein